MPCARTASGKGDRVGTLAWNGHRHFELYYATAGIGAVCHTINPRLSREQLLYIIAHAGDRVLCVDTDLLPLIESLWPDLPEGLRLIFLTDRAHMPETTLDTLCYEDMLAGQPTDYDWPDLPEETASGLCYTSGTTGPPRARSIRTAPPCCTPCRCRSRRPAVFAPVRRVMPVVPMFHVNAWGLPYTAPLTGMTLVMPGPAISTGRACFASWTAKRCSRPGACPRSGRG